MAITKELDEKALNEELSKVNTEIANSVAESKGAKNAKEFIESTNVKINSKNKAVSSMAVKAAGDFTAELLLLCLYQEIETPHSLKYIENIANKFDAGTIPAGNGKEYIIDLLTGSEQWVVTDFNPTSITDPSVYAKYIAMYEKATDGTVTLSPKAYQFKKTLTLRQEQWYPYFTSGDLRTFIENIVNRMIKSYMVYKYDKMATLISTMPITKKITGTATNLFDCLSTEVFPAIEDMTLLNQSYSIDNVNTPNVDTLDFSDMLMFVPLNVKTGLMRGIKSQLFNSHFMEIGAGIPESNIITLGDKITYPTDGSGNRVSVQDGTPYLNKDQIRIIDQTAIKHLQQVNQSGSQSYNNNLTIQMTLHIWGVIDYLSWHKALEYTNPAINVLPNGNTNAPVVNSAEPKTAK